MATASGYDEVGRFIVRQRMRLVGNRYEVRVALPGGEEGELVAYVEQRTFAVKEDLRFYGDESKTVELFRVKARRAFDPAARYRVVDAEGIEIGELAKAFRRSLARSTWRVHAPDGREIAWATERSVLRSLIRRALALADLIPLVGDLIALVPIRYHFDFFAGERRIGSFERLFGLRDRYLLDLGEDQARVLDRRLAIALAVGMDALQAR